MAMIRVHPVEVRVRAEAVRQPGQCGAIGVHPVGLAAIVASVRVRSGSARLLIEEANDFLLVQRTRRRVCRHRMLTEARGADWDAPSPCWGPLPAARAPWPFSRIRTQPPQVCLPR